MGERLLRLFTLAGVRCRRKETKSFARPLCSSTNPIRTSSHLPDTSCFPNSLRAYPGGWLTDHCGQRRSLLLFSSLSLAGYLLVLLWQHWLVLLVGAFLFPAWSALSPTRDILRGRHFTRQTPALVVCGAAPASEKCPEQASRIRPRLWFLTKVYSDLSRLTVSFPTGWPLRGLNVRRWRLGGSGILTFILSLGLQRTPGLWKFA